MHIVGKFADYGIQEIRHFRRNRYTVVFVDDRGTNRETLELQTSGSHHYLDVLILRGIGSGTLRLWVGKKIDNIPYFSMFEQ